MSVEKSYFNFERYRLSPFLQLANQESFARLLNKIILSRHGETDYNSHGLLQGSTDIALSVAGRLEINREASVLENRSPYNISRIVSSNMLRATQTSEIFSQALDKRIPQTRISLFREYAAGDWEGKKIEELLSIDPYHNKWIRKPITYSLGQIPNHGEFFPAFLQRVNNGIKIIEQLSKAMQTDEKILVISHATVNRAIRFLFLLTSEEGSNINLLKAQKNEKNFFFQKDGKFVRVPHGILEIDQTNFDFIKPAYY